MNKRLKWAIRNHFTITIIGLRLDCKWTTIIVIFITLGCVGLCIWGIVACATHSYSHEGENETYENWEIIGWRSKFEREYWLSAGGYMVTLKAPHSNRIIVVITNSKPELWEKKQVINPTGKHNAHWRKKVEWGKRKF